MQMDIKKRILSVAIVLMLLHFILNSAYLNNYNHLNINAREGVDVSLDEQVAIYAILSNIPTILIQNFTMDGNVIHITDSRFHPDYNENSRKSGANAYFYFGEGDDYIEIVKTSHLVEMEYLFYHEFGHYLDYKTDASWHSPNISSYIDFINACNEGIKEPVYHLDTDTYALLQDDYREYYAEQFADMLLVETETLNESEFSNKKVQSFINKNILSLKIKTWLRPNYLRR